MKKFYCIKSINIKVPKKTNTFFALFFNIFFLIGTSTFASGVLANSDSVDATTITAFPIGTYIIDMGQATQTVNNGLKPYGLVYKLIVAGIPVNWAIEETKTKDGIDFYATSAGNPNKAYKGGSFIVDVVTYPAAKDIINSWKTLYSGLVVDIATAPFSAPIYKTLSIWPKAFLDADNDTLITPYYTNAGIPSNTYQINANPTLLPQCGSSTGTQDVYILPHADPDTWNATWISTLQNFIDNGGSMWAGCHAVSVMEGLPGCNFLSVNGLVNYKVPGHTAGSPAYTYLPSADNDPIMQFIGITDAALQGGSEDIYVPGPAGWRNTTVLAAYDANYVNAVPNPDVQYIYPNAAAVIAYGPAFGDASKGMIMYETGHSFNGTDAKSVAAQRAFFNFLLLAGGQPQNSIAPPPNMSNQSITTCSGVPFNFIPAGAAANVTYSWTVLPTGSGFTGATVQTAGQTSISQTLTLTTSNPGVAVYTITPKIGLCSGTPFTLTVTVNPPIPIITLTSGAGTNTVTTPIGIAMKNITYATTGATGVTFSGLPPGVTGTWSGGIVTISGVPTNPVGVYNYTVNVAGCSNVSTAGSITTYVCPTFSLLSTSTSSVNVCVGSSSLITLTANAANLPVGNYAVTYNIQGVDQADATMTVTTAGIGSFVYTGFTSAGDRTVTITKITSGLCSSVISANNMDTITVVAVLAAPTALAGSGATCTQITANWTALSGAAYYELDVSVSSTFDSFISGYNALNVGLVTSYNVTGLTIGTPYYYRVRAFNGNCISSSSSTITYATAANPGTPSGLTTIVNACDELTVSWTAGSGATSYEIQWSTNASNFATILGTAIGITTLKYTITGLTSGIAYKYRVRSVNGCNSSAYVPSGSITAAGSVPTRPGSISPTANSTFCNQFSVNWPAGTGATSYRIDWSTNSSFPTGFASVSGITDLTYTITGLTAATAYFYRIYSENGCGLSTVRNGTPTSVTTLSATPSAPIGVGSSSILCTQFTMSWTASTGAISYTVERALDSGFSNGLVTVTDITATTYTFTGLNSGTNYYYRVRAVSCNSSANGNGSPAFITTSSSLPTTPTIAGALTFCENNSVTLGANTGVSGSYDWYWNGSLISTETTGFLFVITPGSYTVRFTNASGCQSAASAASVIVLQGLPTATAGGSQSICANATATVSGAAATNGDVLWTANGAGTITSGATTLTPTYTPAAGDAGNAVTLTMTVTSNNTCAPQTAIATYTVNVAAVPTAGLTSNDADNTFCIGTSVTFTATGGTNYNFRVAGISVQNSTTAIYTSTTLTNGQVVDVIVTNAAGCSATSPGITNSVNALPTAVLTSSDTDNIFCAGTSVTFTATGGTNYNFRVAGITVQNGAAATYTTTTLTNGQVVDVIVSNAAGCSATSPGITNTVNTLPTAGLTSSDTDNIFCAGTSVTFTATGGTNYNFRVAGITVQNGATAIYTTTTLTNSQVVDVIVTNAAGCSATSPGITNTVNTLPTAGLTSSDADNIFCAGTPVTFTATGGTNYNFRVAGITVQNGAAATYTSTTLINGQVVDVIVINASGCSTTSPGITNTVNTLPTSGLTSSDTDNIFCAGTPVTFTATGGTNYNFRVVGISVQNGAAATYTSTTLTNGQVVDVIVSNAAGCSATSPGITNTVSALPVINTQPISQLDCEAASVNFKAVVTGTGLTYTWQRKKVTDSSFVTIPTEGNISYPSTGVIKVDNIGSSQSPNGTQFQVVVSDSSGCSVVSAIATLSVNEITDVLPKTTAVTQCYGTNYSYTVSTSYPANVVSYQWKSAVASGVWNTVSNGPHFSGATTPTLNIINGTPSESAEYRVYITFRSSGADCNVTSASRTRTLTFLPLLTTPVTTVTQPTCTIPTGTIAVTVQSAGDSYSFDNGGSYQAGNVKSGSATGNYSVIIKNSQNCISATASTTINAQPATPLAPVVGAITQPACSLATGSVVLSGLPAGGTLNPGTIAYVGTTCTVSNLATSTYSYTVTNPSGCISANSSSVLITPLVTNTWSASGWSSGSNPTVDQNIVFDFDFSSTADLAGCTCQIRSGRSITINPLHTLTVNNAISVLGTGTLIFKSDQTHTPSSSASLVQINDGANTGNITFERMTNTVVRNTDYTYWSSPVAAYTLGGVSQNKTKSDKYYSYEPTATGQDWKQESAATVMAPGKGYIIRGPEPPTVVSPYIATFTGVPNNGPYSITPILAGKNYLLGNPYPSALNADTFLNENAGVLDGTLYFWTHNTQIQLASNITDGSAGSGAYAYTSNDYASYNITGGVGITDKAKNPGGNGFIPSGKIAAGQGFFGTTKANGSGSAIVFNNAMRVTGTSNNNSQFFKTGSAKAKTAEIIEKHRIWLDLTNSQGAFKQTLVGYITGATNDYDSRFDGESLDGNQFVDFYSINQNKHLTIQGRAMPFDENDLVPLGFRTTIDGIFTLKIDQVDGLFWNQAVFLEDKLTNTLFDLKRDGYTFTTASGTYNDRFVLRYTGETLGTAAVEKPANQILVSIQNQQLKINSSAETIDRVVVYDLSGKQRCQKRKVNSNEVLLTTLAPSHQILLVKTVLHNGKSSTQKVLF